MRILLFDRMSQDDAENLYIFRVIEAPPGFVGQSPYISVIGDILTPQYFVNLPAALPATITTGTQTLSKDGTVWTCPEEIYLDAISDEGMNSQTFQGIEDLYQLQPTVTYSNRATGRAFNVADIDIPESQGGYGLEMASFHNDYPHGMIIRPDLFWVYQGCDLAEDHVVNNLHQEWVIDIDIRYRSDNSPIEYITFRRGWRTDWDATVYNIRSCHENQTLYGNEINYSYSNIVKIGSLGSVAVYLWDRPITWTGREDEQPSRKLPGIAGIVGVMMLFGLAILSSGSPSPARRPRKLA